MRTEMAGGEALVYPEELSQGVAVTVPGRENNVQSRLLPAPTRSRPSWSTRSGPST